MQNKPTPRASAARLIPLIATLLALAFCFRAHAQTLVYSADFESGTPAEFSTGSTTSAQIGTEAVNQGMSTYLGQFTLANSTTLVVTGLPAHSFVRLDVDAYFFNSWDGSSSFGPDSFSLAGDMTFSETFTNHHGTAQVPNQTYPTLADVYLSSDGNSTSSFGTSNATFAYFSIGPTSSGTGFIVPHATDTFTVTFAGPTSQNDEQWGIDNVRVTVCDSAENCDTGAQQAAAPPAPVPALGGAGLLVLSLVLGLIGMAGARRRFN